MNSPLLLTLFLSFVAINLYFQLAARFNIIDKPNERSSHTQLTLRGAGILFPLVMLVSWMVDASISSCSIVSNLFKQPWILGLLLISTVSFIDDIRPLSSRSRVLFHLTAVATLLFSVSAPVWMMVVALVLVVGTINAYNFMDGINGITGLYSLVTLLGFYGLNRLGIDVGVSESFILNLMVAMAVFLFYNLRKRAKCFCGDVGSVSMAFLLTYVVYRLVVVQSDPIYILMFGVYGIDAVGTIMLRLMRRENIFEAHRSHYYQFLANERRWPHIWVSLLFAFVQLLLNVMVIHYPDLAYFSFVGLVLLYAMLRRNDIINSWKNR